MNGRFTSNRTARKTLAWERLDKYNIIILSVVRSCITSVPRNFLSQIAEREMWHGDRAQTNILRTTYSTDDRDGEREGVAL